MDNSNPEFEFENSDPRDPSHSIPEGYDGDSDDVWVSEDDVKALADEADALGYQDEHEQAEAILKENLPAVTLSVIKLARSAQSETVRLNAAKYVIDRNLGKIGDTDSGEESPTTEFLRGVVVRSE